MSPIQHYITIVLQQRCDTTALGTTFFEDATTVLEYYSSGQLLLKYYSATTEAAARAWFDHYNGATTHTGPFQCCQITGLARYESTTTRVLECHYCGPTATVLCDDYDNVTTTAPHY
eukprot:8704193-Pyramimonas_sp.AAC.1